MFFLDLDDVNYLRRINYLFKIKLSSRCLIFVSIYKIQKLCKFDLRIEHSCHHSDSSYL